MPKKLNISSNERVDLVDFNRAAADYTQESDNFDRKQLLLSKRSLIASGFRIELADQTTNPGQFTIYNGLGIDKDGNLLNNEDQINDARTLTLSGATTDFYIEVEFVESESDVDSRAFWDPTFSGNTPPGKEFSLSVATRLSPDWQISTPVSTSAFESTATLSSIKIPVAILTTDGANAITAVGVNISTVLEEDALTAATVFRVKDASVFPASGVATLDGESVNFTVTNRANGLITIAPGLAGDHLAGSIFVQTDASTDNWVTLDTAAVPSTDEDRRRRLYAGDEIRGSALSSSPITSGARSDLEVANLKDHVDFLAAQIREMKFGNLRSDVAGGLPPSSWTNTRYYDPVGSIPGSRAATYTIGDGVASFGDINVTSSDVAAALQTAHNALDAISGGSIFVKEGDYVWNSTFTTNRPVKIVFGEGVRFIAGTYSGGIEILTTDKVTIEGMPLTDGLVGAADITTSAGNLSGMSLTLTDSAIGRLIVPTAIPASSVDIVARRSSFMSTTITATDHTISFDNDSTNRINSAVFEDCSIAYNSSSADSPTVLVYGNLNGVVFRRCTFDAALGTNSCDGFVFTDSAAAFNPADWTFDECSFVDTGTATVERGLTFDGQTDSDRIRFVRCTFDFNYAATPTSQRVVEITAAATGSVDGCLVDSCDFSAIGTNTIPNTSAGTRGAIVYLSGSFGGEPWGEENTVKGSTFGKPIVGDTVPTDFVDLVYSDTTGDLIVTDNTFLSAVSGVWCLDGGLIARGNVFKNDAGSTTWIASDTTAISFDGETAERLMITDNVIDFQAGTNTGNNTIGIDLVGSVSGEDQAPIVANNTIKIYMRSGTMAGIRSINTTSDPELNATGNLIAVGSSFISANATLYGIWFGYQFTYAIDHVIANNTIRVTQTTSGGGDSYGIYAIYAADDEGTASLVVSNNTVDMLTGNGAVSDPYGIWVQAIGANVTGNTIRQTGRTSGSNLGACISLQGHMLVCTSNSCMTFSTSHGPCIEYFPTTSTFIEAPGNTCISNNTIFQRGSTYGIYVLNAEDDVGNINVIGNVIGSRQSTASTATLGVEISSTGSDTFGFNVSNNSIHEATAPSTTNFRKAINLQQDSTHGGSCVNSNIITSVNTAVVRSTSSAAIRVNGGEGVTVNGNTVRGWVGTGANRTSIDILSVTESCVNSNNLEYSGAAGEDCIDITGTDAMVSANIIANSGVDGVDTSGVAGTVVTSGSNLTA